MNKLKNLLTLVLLVTLVMVSSGCQRTPKPTPPDPAPMTNKSYWSDMDAPEPFRSSG